MIVQVVFASVRVLPWRLPAVILLVAALCASPSFAQQPVTGEPDASWRDRSTLTGDWAGRRTALEHDGIRLHAGLTTESAANPIGGSRQSARYTQEISFGVDLDLSRALGLPKAKAQVLFTDRAGRSLSADAIGNLFAVQQLYGAGQNFRIVEVNYQQNLLQDRLTVELGWSPVGDNFASLPAFCDFQSGFICGHLSPMTTNSGAHNYPVGQWGARIRVDSRRHVYAQAGLYQVNPDEGQADKGLDLSFHGTGALIPVEVGWQPQGGRPGIYKVGGYYNSSDSPDVLDDFRGYSAGITGATFMRHSGRFGGYVAADQVIHRNDADPRRLLRIGAIMGIGDSSTAVYRYFVAAGGVRQGVLRRSDGDYISVLFGYALTNPRLTQYQRDRNAAMPGVVAVQTYESISEVDYNIQLAPWLSVRPNLQYVLNPGGTGHIPNAVVAGLHTDILF